MDSCLKLIRLWFGFSFLVTERFFHSFGVLFRIMGDRLNLMSARYRWISFRKCWVIQEFNELLIMETLSSSLFFTNQLASIQYHACATHKPYCMKIHSHSCRCKPCSMGAQIHHRNKLWIFPRAHRAHLIIAQLSSTTVFTSLYTNAKKYQLANNVLIVCKRESVQRTLNQILVFFSMPLSIYFHTIRIINQR